MLSVVFSKPKVQTGFLSETVTYTQTAREPVLEDVESNVEARIFGGQKAKLGPCRCSRLPMFA